MTADEILDALRDVLDPEIGINVVDLGLVYRAEVDGDRVHVAMTMTSPACPLGAYLTGSAEAAIRRRVPAAREVEVELVWEPRWEPEMMSPAARQQLGWRPDR